MRRITPAGDSWQGVILRLTRNYRAVTVNELRVLRGVL